MSECKNCGTNLGQGVAEYCDLRCELEDKNHDLLMKNTDLREMLQCYEYSKLVYRGPGEVQVYCCLQCGGVKPDEYDRLKLAGDKRYLRGHADGCRYAAVMGGS